MVIQVGRGMALLVGVVLLSAGCVSDDDPAAGCGPANCAGCCAGGLCYGGNDSAACGWGGYSCQTCFGGAYCSSGTCFGGDPTCPATADCSGRQCGLDPVCFTSCGTCTGGLSCNDVGQCVAGGCADHFECDGNSLCLYGRCELAWGRAYEITIYDGQIMERNPTDGSCWDDPCGAPDSRVTLWIDGTPHLSGEASDSYNPVWDSSFTATLLSSSTYRALMVDVDVMFDDTMFDWGEHTISIDHLKHGGIQFVDATETVNLINVFIEPAL